MLRNPGAKILALLIACVLWAQVADRSQITEVAALPLRLSGLPDSLVVRSRSLPDVVQVRISGSRLQFLLDDLLGREKGHIVLELSDARPGFWRIDLDATDVRTTGQAEEVVGPTALSLQLQRRLVRLLPVRMTPEGQLPEGITLSGPPEISPSKVEVSGPESVVAALDAIRTVPVPLGRRRESFREQVALQTTDPDIKLHPVEVLLEVGIDRIVERSFVNVPVAVLSELDPARVHVEPTTATVRLSGPALVVEELGAEEIGVLLHITESRAGVYQRKPEIVVPPERGIIARSVEPSRFQIVIEGADRDGAP